MDIEKIETVCNEFSDGFCIGKFSFITDNDIRLIKDACMATRNLTVFTISNIVARERISQMFPHIQVINILDPNCYELNDVFQDTWRSILKKYEPECGYNISFGDSIFSMNVARSMGVRFIRIGNEDSPEYGKGITDHTPSRIKIGVIDTQDVIHQLQYTLGKHKMSSIVSENFMEQELILGKMQADDLIPIVGMTYIDINTLSQFGYDVVISELDPMYICIWCRHVFGYVRPDLEKIVNSCKVKFDFILIREPDRNKYDGEIAREQYELDMAIYNEYISYLKKENIPYLETKHLSIEKVVNQIS